jgi:hypothetical protein
MERTFSSHYVGCQTKDCTGNTRLPLPNPLEKETSLISSPTVSEPLLVLCNRCWKVSRYSKADFQEGRFPESAISAHNRIYLIQIECGAENCGALTKIYIRDPARIQEPFATDKAMEGVGGSCPKEHEFVETGAKVFVKPLLETRQ